MFGEGPETARIVFVGEQPGDQEDRKGEPFVGPAGKLLDRALADAGIDRRDAYVTNAVKHFRFTVKGKRRIHQTPGPEHLRACRPWLEAEFAVLKPEVVVCLGATAAKALISPSFRITKDRGQLLPWTPPGARRRRRRAPGGRRRRADEGAPRRRGCSPRRTRRRSCARRTRAAPPPTTRWSPTSRWSRAPWPDEPSVTSGVPELLRNSCHSFRSRGARPVLVTLGGGESGRASPRTPHREARNSQNDGHDAARPRPSRRTTTHAAGHHRDGDPGRAGDAPRRAGRPAAGRRRRRR